MARKSTDDLRAPRPIIRINQRLIETAKRKSSSHCMIADAIKDQVPDASLISVDLQTIRFSNAKRGLRFIYLTPRPAQQALALFDMGRAVPDFTIRLRGASIISMNRGKKNQKHKLGARRLNITKRDRALHTVPEQIGGQAPPRAPGSSRRQFGMRAFTLDDVLALPKPKRPA